MDPIRQSGPACAAAAQRFMAFRKRKAQHTKAANAPGGKICSACERWLPFSEYYHRKDSACGLRAECKPCHRARGKVWRVENAEHVREYSRARWHTSPRYRARKTRTDAVRVARLRKAGLIQPKDRILKRRWRLRRRESTQEFTE